MKRRQRKWFALVLALASGGAAGYLALNYLQSPGTSRAEAAGSTQVAVAARDLALGTVVTAADVKMVDWPGTAVPPGYASRTMDVVGRGLITAVSANEPLMTQKMAPKGAGGGLSIVIPEGMRAVSVKVDEVVGVAGFVLPGTRVDVLVTLNPTSEREEMATRVILQNVQTLAAGQTIQRDAEGKPQTVTVITLLVDPVQAEKLTLAATEGQIHLALRNMLDLAVVETEGVRAAELVGSPVVAPAPTPSVARPARAASGVRRDGTTVVTFNGAERTETTF